LSERRAFAKICNGTPQKSTKPDEGGSATVDFAVAGLALLSAAIHPLREFIMKGSRYPAGGYLAVVILWLPLTFGHTMIAGADLAAPLKIWPVVLFSTLGFFLFYVGMLETVKRGDLSVYYPIARASPLFIVAVGFLFLGHSYTPTMLLGIGLVLVGAFFLQYKRGARFLRQPAALIAALVAMSGTGLYSLADAEAMRSVEPMAMMACVYVLLVPCCIAYFVFTRPRGERIAAHLFIGWLQTPWRFAAAAVLSYLSYYLILLCYQLGGNVAAVGSLRLAAIPISVILGGRYLKEADTRTRLAWSLVLAAGMVVIIFAR
jgi:drug/metabolite transporter (DMT)-like permease